MKPEHNYRIIHQQITQFNQEEIILKISNLYQELWSLNSKASIQARIKQFANPNITLVYDQDRLIAFGIYHLIRIKRSLVQYRAGAVVDPNYRSQGLYTKMLTTTIEKHFDRSLIICVRTREIPVYKALQNLTILIPGSVMYPTLNGEKGREAIPAKVLAIMHHFSGTLEDKYLPRAPNVYQQKKLGDFQVLFDLNNNDALMVVLKAR